MKPITVMLFMPLIVAVSTLMFVTPSDAAERPAPQELPENETAVRLTTEQFSGGSAKFYRLDKIISVLDLAEYRHKCFVAEIAYDRIERQKRGRSITVKWQPPEDYALEWIPFVFGKDNEIEWRDDGEMDSQFGPMPYKFFSLTYKNKKHECIGFGRFFKPKRRAEQSKNVGGLFCVNPGSAITPKLAGEFFNAIVFGETARASSPEKLSPASERFGVGLSAFKRADYATALNEWRPLAEQGHARAQAKIAIMHARGSGVSKDHAEAAKWYRKAAEGGNVKAQMTLSQMYKKGQGVSRDYGEAVKWLLEAAKRDFVKAQLDLGRAYKKGEGVAKDLAESYFWFTLVAKRGQGTLKTIAPILGANVAKGLTSRQKKEAEERARAWRPQVCWPMSS